MSRSGYSDDLDNHWQLIRWRGQVASAIRGKRGQSFLREMRAALDELPVKRLAAHELETTDVMSCSHWGQFEIESFCAIGAVGKRRGIDMTALDPEDGDSVAGTFDIARQMALEIVYENDESGYYRETPEARFMRMREWVESKIRGEQCPSIKSTSQSTSGDHL